MTLYSDILYRIATDSRGQGHRTCGLTPYLKAVVTHPKKEDSVLKHSVATWTRTENQAGIEAAYWRTRGYDAEILDAVPATEAEYDATRPRPISIVARTGYGGFRVEDGVDSEATADV